MRVALLGYGTVGKGVFELLKSNFKDIEITKILVKENNKHQTDLFTTDYNEVLNTKPDIIFEMTVGDVYELISTALKNKIHVISSNKVTVAAHFWEYLELAKQNNVSFRFEASVCAAIPIVDEIIKVSRFEKIKYIKGIMNGTTNYILDKMSKENIEFNEALKEAQLLGYAESDPTNDIEGLDILRKIMILSCIASHAQIDLNKIFVSGIKNINLDDIRYFDNMGYIIKMLAVAEFNDTYNINVEPTLIKKNNIIANINLNNNFVSYMTNSSKELSFIGAGAGKFETAHAMINDFVDITKGNKQIIEFENNIYSNKENDEYEYIFKTNIKLNHKYIKEYKNNYLYTNKINSKQKVELYEILKKDNNMQIFKIGE